MENKSPLSGLTKEEVKTSREEFGENVLTPPEKEPWWRLFLEKFEDPIIRVLLVAAFLSLGIAFLEGEFAETIGIFCAILLSTGIAFWFEYDAGKKFDLLGSVDDDTLYKVIREGEVHEIRKRDLVVGDLVILETGEEIPADGQLLESLSLMVNESNLTGEPVVSKSADPERADPEATYPTDQLMRGTTLVEGHGTIRITAVGDQTEFGKVARQSTIKSTEKTPLTRQLDRLAQFIGVAGFGLALVTFLTLSLKDLILSGFSYTFAQFWTLGAATLAVVILLVKIWVPIAYDGLDLLGKKRKLPRIVARWSWLAWVGIALLFFGLTCGAGYLFFGIDPLASGSWIALEEAQNYLQYFMIAVTLIVVAVPEGLPMSVTLSLALSMRRMLKSNNLVRKMHATETMGATTVICTDKTGTLTQNKMSVHEALFYAVPGPGLDDGEVSEIIRQNMAVNSTAFLEHEESGQVKPVGNPTEGALLLWLDSQGVNYTLYREKAVIVDQIPFSTERKFMATLIQSGERRLLLVKGAPEIVFARCKTVRTEKGEIPASAYAETVKSQLLEYQNHAMRTLGFAYADLPTTTDGKATFEENEWVFLGAVAIMDPVREDAPQAVANCLSAGIAVKIITGDTSATAKEIGRRVGLWEEHEPDEHHITGAEFEALSDEELLGRVASLKIMSRARPTDKQRLVQLLQQNGEVVAVTGDGTNDAPALNFAQVGISMGSGTSVAKEASDITLLDDSFSSIATAVMWGRSLYRNIQRFIIFQLTINFTALVVVFLGSIFGTELPLTVTQMLWVNLIMDTFAAGALASLPPDPKVMRDKPRKSNAFIITQPMKRAILWTGGLFILALLGMLIGFTRDSVTTVYEMTIFFTVFVMLQVWNLFNARVFESNDSAFKGLMRCKPFLIVVLTIVLGQILIVNFAGEVFRTVPISWQEWGIIIGCTSMVLWAGEIQRFFKRKKQNLAQM